MIKKMVADAWLDDSKDAREAADPAARPGRPNS
jgi:hypothetical protein